MFTKTSALSPDADQAQLDSRHLDPMMTLSQSSLKTTREAIARWTRGTVTPARPAGQRHVSVQQRWFAQAQKDLSAWIHDGGFSQACDPAAAAPAAAPLMAPPPMYTLPRFLRMGTSEENACVE